MSGRLTFAQRRAKEVWAGFTPGQRTVSALVLLALVLGGVMFMHWASKPSYAPLFSNLSASDASAITQKLSQEKVSYELADGGSTVLVPEKQVYQLRLDMSSANLPTGDQSGYALLDKQGITTSDFQQHVQYQRALEGEITRTVEAIDGVQSAVVHLAIPNESVFATETSKPTASVLVKTLPGQALTSDQTQAIVHLVSSSVANLDPADVTVADAAGHVLNADDPTGAAGTFGDTRQQQTEAFQDRVAGSLQDMLDQVVGPGHAVVRVSADLDFDATNRTTESYLQPAKNAVPLSVAKTKEAYKGAGSPAGGVLGPDNTGVPGAVGGKNNYNRHEVTQDNAVGKVTEQVQTAPGAVKRMSVAVLLDERTAGTVDPQRVETLVTQAAGLQTTRGDSIAVDSMPFDTTAAKQAATELAQAAKAHRTQWMLSAAKSGGLLLIVLLVIGLLIRRSRGPVAVETVPASIIAELEEARRALTARESEPLAVEMHERPTLPPGLDSDGRRRIAVQEEIGALVESQPDEVAQLLRSWLADRRS